MALKQFNRFGLRRDNNLSDLPSSITALNNILNTPTMLVGEKEFSALDLEPIKQIYVTNLSGGTFASLVGITVAFSVIVDGVIDNAQGLQVYRPLLKIKNRLDTAYFSTGEPYFFGGDGPTATYYDANKIVRDPEALQLNTVYTVGNAVLSNNKIYVTQNNAITTTPLTHTFGTINGFTYAADYDIEKVFLNDEYDELTGEKITYSDNFWEQGQFIYDSKVLSSFISLFGGVNWQGFYKPIQSGTASFYLRTTGGTVFKFQDSSYTPSSILGRYGKVNANFMTFLSTVTQQTIVNNNLPYNINQINEVLEIYNDPTRQLVEVTLSEPLRIKHNDILYLDVSEGQVPPQQYRVLTHRDFSKSTASKFTSGEYVASFWIELTTEFNRLNLNSGDLPDSNAGLSQTGTFREQISQSLDINGVPTIPFGLVCTVRYMPYERRVYRTFINSIYHKLNIPQGSFTITGTTTFTCDDFYYYHFMITDYIYDYRKRGTDVQGQGVRRWVVTGLNDNTKTVTVALDTTYNSVNQGNNNDQQAYIDGLSLTFEDNGGEEINTTYTTGSLNDSISSDSVTRDLYFVGLYGSTTQRYKFINIPEFLEAYTEYAIDWLYFTKDEDISPVAPKTWILWYRTDLVNYTPLNYKYLYSPNYKFYQIGDFKTFVDNTVLSGGTSREIGVDQRAFGKPQLASKGDQYSELYTLLPLKSIYSPKENWSKVALTRTSTLTSGSRLITLGTTDIKIGNYIIENSNDGFTVGSSIPLRTRIIEIIPNSTSVIVSKPSKSTTSVSSFVFDHRGFVTSGYIQGESAKIYRFYGDASELQVGMNVVAVKDPSRSSYNRITRIEPTVSGYTLLSLEQDFANVSSTIQGPFASSSNNSFPNAQYGWFTRTGLVQTNPYTQIRQLVIRWNNVTLFDSLSTSDFPTSGGITLPDGYTYYPDQYYNTTYGWSADQNNAFGIKRELTGGQSLCAVYYDRGVDITKPLASFCTSTGCAQQNYNRDTDTAETRYISLLIDTQDNSNTDLRWTESSLTGSYSGQDDPNRIIFTNGAASVSWWSDSYPNKTGPNQGTRVGGTSTASALQTGYTINSGDAIQNRKRYGGGAVYANFDGTGLGNAIKEQYPEFPTNGYYPIGMIEGVVRIRGDIRNGTDDGSRVYYLIIRVFDRLQSIPHNNFGFWKGGELLSDGVTKKGHVVDLTKYPSTHFNFTKIGINGQDLDMTLPYQGQISTKQQMETIYTNYINDASNNYINTADRMYQLIAPITITTNEANTWFYNPSSFVTDNGDGTLTYTMPSGSWFKTYSLLGYLMWFNDFEDIQDTETLFVYRPPGNTLPTNQPGGNQDLVNIFPQEGVVKVTSNDWQNDQFEFLHYRRQQYEITPMPTFIEDRYPGIRLINSLSTNTETLPHLINSTNRLSVLTFANTTDNKELCCPPLDTSPPFDSSDIGLSTTTNEPDMSIAGLVNVRSITATHPTSKIYNIPSTINGQAPNTQLPVNKKLGIVFGGIEYDLLIGDSKPF